MDPARPISRRSILTILASGGVLALAGCEEQGAEHPEYHQALVDEVRHLREAIESLKSDIESFDRDNWRDVVPKAQDGIQDVLNRLKNLEDAIRIH